MKGKGRLGVGASFAWGCMEHDFSEGLFGVFALFASTAWACCCRCAWLILHLHGCEYVADGIDFIRSGIGFELCEVMIGLLLMSTLFVVALGRKLKFYLKYFVIVV